MKRIFLILSISITISFLSSAFFVFDFFSSDDGRLKAPNIPPLSEEEINQKLIARFKVQDDKKKIFPPSILDHKTLILKNKDKQILAYWAEKLPESTMNWANSQKNTRLLILRFIYPIWLQKDTASAIRWYEFQSTKEDLYSFLVDMGRYGDYTTIIKYVDKKIENNQEIPTILLSSFFLTNINTKRKHLQRWVLEQEETQILFYFLLSLAQKKNFREVETLMKIYFSNIALDKYDFQHPIYQKIYISYFNIHPIEALVDLVENNPLTKDNAEYYFKFLFERYNNIFSNLNKKKHIIKTKKTQDVIFTLKQTQLALAGKISFPTLIKKFNPIDERLIEQAYRYVFMKKYNDIFNKYPQQSINILEKYNIKDHILLDKFITSQKNDLKQNIVTHPKLFYNSHSYQTFASTWDNTAKAIKFLKTIAEKDIALAFLTSLIENSKSSSFDFMPYCQELTDVKSKMLAYVSLSKRLLRYDKQKAVTLFINNYHLESQVLSFFKLLIKIDSKLAIDFFTNNRFSLYTESLLAGIIAYNNPKDVKLIAKVRDLPAIKEKAYLAVALNKYDNFTNFNNYINSLPARYKNKVLIYCDKLLRNK